MVLPGFAVLGPSTTPSKPGRAALPPGFFVAGSPGMGRRQNARRPAVPSGGRAGPRYINRYPFFRNVGTGLESARMTQYQIPNCGGKKTNLFCRLAPAAAANRRRPPAAPRRPSRPAVVSGGAPITSSDRKGSTPAGSRPGPAPPESPSRRRAADPDRRRGVRRRGEPSSHLSWSPRTWRAQRIAASPAGMPA